MKKLFFIAALLLLSSRLFAQATNTATTPTRQVFGIIKDASGHALAGVNVLLVVKGETLKATTNNDGVFAFNEVKEATFQVSVTNAGYVPFAGLYKLNDIAKSITLNIITLKKDSE